MELDENVRELDCQNQTIRLPRQPEDDEGQQEEEGQENGNTRARKYCGILVRITSPVRARRVDGAGTAQG